MTDELIEATLQRNADNSGGFCSEVLNYINRLKEQLYQAEQKLAECEVGYQGALDLERRMAIDAVEKSKKDTAREIL